MIQKTNHDNGFSLLELSLVMVVMAFVATGLMRVAINSIKVNKEDETYRKMEVISKRLALFVKDNARLPCPSDGSLPASNIDYGVEQVFDNGAAIANTCQNGLATSGNIHIGSVPTKTLDLSDDYMLDGWERRFNYAVDMRFTNSPTTYTVCDGTTTLLSECFEFLSTGEIEVGTSVDGAERTTEAVYVLVSHGSNGHGAFTRGGGSRLNVSATNEEEENAHIDNNFDGGFLDIEANDNFDDIVYYAEKYQIIANIWPPLEESVCEVAKNVVDNPDPAVNETCTGLATGGPLEACEAYAQNIHAVCAGLYN